MKPFIGRALLACAMVLVADTSASAAPDVEQYLTPGCAEGSSKPFCDRSRKDFPGFFRKALRGDYQAQRNVAFCLYDGCDGAVRPNPITACAWRMIILTSGSLKIDSSDMANLRMCRERLSSEEWIAVSGQVRALSGMVKR